MDLPNIEKSDKFIINCNGLIWVYKDKKEIFIVNKDGMKIIKFNEIEEECLKDILESEKDDITFKNKFHAIGIDDLVYRPKKNKN